MEEQDEDDEEAHPPAHPQLFLTGGARALSHTHILQSFLFSQNIADDDDDNDNKSIHLL